MPIHADGRTKNVISKLSEEMIDKRRPTRGNCRTVDIPSGLLVALAVPWKNLSESVF